MEFPESRVGVILLRFAGSSKAIGWLTFGVDDNEEGSHEDTLEEPKAS